MARPTLARRLSLVAKPRAALVLPKVRELTTPNASAALLGVGLRLELG